MPKNQQRIIAEISLITGNLAFIFIRIKPAKRRFHFHVLIKFPLLPAANFYKVFCLGVVTLQGPQKYRVIAGNSHLIAFDDKIGEF